MKTSITLYRAYHRRLKRQAQRSRNVLHTRHILAILYLANGQSVNCECSGASIGERVSLDTLLSYRCNMPD